jgi:hypothetical protein
MRTIYKCDDTVWELPCTQITNLTTEVAITTRNIQICFLSTELIAQPVLLCKNTQNELYTSVQLVTSLDVELQTNCRAIACIHRHKLSGLKS